MPIPTRATLKSYFETGDVPTQAQFIEMIDAMYDLAQGATDAADAAQTAAEDAEALVEARAAKAFGTFTWTGTTWSLVRLTGGAVVFTGAGGVTATVTFSTALIDDEFTVSGDLWGLNGTVVANVTSRTAAAVVFSLPPNGSSGLTIGDRFDFAIYR